jgi:GDP-L-fucose synthase
MNKNSKIYVAGHKGLAGSAILRKLQEEGYTNFLLRTHDELDLTDQKAVDTFFKENNPEFVFDAAAKVGGIIANSTYKADFIYLNLEIQNNLIHSAYKYGVEKLLFLGSTCIYPAQSPQPMKEEYLLTGPLEPTNDAYAIAKIAGIKMCQFYNEQYETNFISVMPTNLYGYNDNFDLNGSHMVPALIRKIYEAKINGKESMTLWGTGMPLRDILFSDDFADAVVYLMNTYSGNDFLNIGMGEDHTIREFAEIVSDIQGYKGKIEWDTSKPDGMYRKQLDVTRLTNAGWKPKNTLRQGLEKSINWFVEHYDEINKKWPAN